ncbi:proton-conducting transporter transmembrane domain-containing protein, partial [Escherichia coli]|uniref:proton-conducting transporter transmembrane domain-containing protein n=1 Tax=Escherichia coli TaxID=562 RepID=UPI0025510DD7
ETRGRYFHAIFHFLLMGLCGAFLTGDLFNLFVFFEILLMASYVLLLHGQGKPRFQLGVHYVIINLLASALFLIGLGMIYGSVGSLNMADVSRLLPTLDADQHKLAVAGALLLFVVFGIKAAMLPVGFWLPKTYAVASTPVAAIFTIMTKVGIYAILRVNGTVFNDVLSQEIFKSWLLPIGLV